MKTIELCPEFFENRTLGNLTPGAQLLFIGLLMLVDDTNSMRFFPKKILGSIYPAARGVGLDEVWEWLNELFTADCAHFGKRDGGLYLVLGSRDLPEQQS